MNVTNKNLCKAMVLTKYIGGKARCKRTKKYGDYCYQHEWLNRFTGYRIDRNFKDGIVV